jgi:beta-N-acetylhexosaminidase
MPAMKISRKLALLAVPFVLIMTPSFRSRAQSKSSKSPSQQFAASRWARKTLGTMTLREKIGQMLMVPVFGEFTSSDSPAYQELRHQIDDNAVGGLIISTARGPLGLRRSQVYPTVALLNDLQRASKVPLLVGADFENGTRMRLEEGTSLPSPMAIAATGEPQLAYEAGKALALEARAAGVQWIFAPDADVNSNPQNPIINVRSFGEDPQEVSRYVREYVRGIEENGAIATAKHFPGHGDVSVDSHLVMPSVSRSRDQIAATELVPFRAAIGAGVSSVMPGHLEVAAFEKTPGTPATLSKSILTGVLRGQLQFRGLVITDAMDMGGVANNYTPGDAAVRAVAAGEDVILMSPSPDAAIAAIEQAVTSGRIPEERIDESVLRILTAKSRLNLDRNAQVNLNVLNRTFAMPQTQALAQSIADRGVTLLRNSDNVLPLDSTKPSRVLLVSVSGDPDSYPGETLEPELRKRFGSLQAMRADTRFSRVANLKVPPPSTYDLAIAALFVRVADGKGNVGIPDDQRRFVNQLVATGKPVVVAAFGSPYLIGAFPNVRTWLAEFATSDVAQRAAARAMVGEVAVSGKIPVTVPGAANRGDGMQMAAAPMTLKPSPSLAARLKPAFDALQGQIANNAYPGAVLAVGYKGELAVHAVGKFTRDPKAKPMKTDTLFDVASMTKVIVTTSLTMMLVEQNKLDLDAPVQKYLPEFAAAAKSDPNPDWRSRITVRNLMLHDSGLPAHRDFFLQAKGYDAVVKLVMAEPLVHEPGTQVEYSDLGLILEGEIVHRLYGETLDKLAPEKIFKPLGMKNSLFNPPKSMRGRIAPTEVDKSYRKKLMWGEVHDENAWAMGGVAGHAGLFTTAGDIAIFAQMMLNGGIYGHTRLIQTATIDQFTTRHTIGNSMRAIGWDVPTSVFTSGHYFDDTSYGHTGFTGTSIWVDPKRELFVIMLTNRVNPTRDNEKIREARPAVHDAIFHALGLDAQGPAR